MELIIKIIKGKKSGGRPYHSHRSPKNGTKPHRHQKTRGGFQFFQILLKKGEKPNFFAKKLEITPTLLEKIGTMRASFFCLRALNIVAATLLIKPVLSRPAPIIMTAIIESTALNENPVNKSEGSGKKIYVWNLI
ncbi:MAG: hypothetical protein CM15mP85_15840 [Rhodobacterales bacterium]|nr:MAG: hypothetical protein CM15mP85_15840 [Rhodobacterales bacterium]